MKEEFTARMLVLGMILIMLSATSLAAETEVPATGLDDPAYAGQNLIYKNDAYYVITDDTVILPIPDSAAAEPIKEVAAPARTVVVEAMKDVKRETNENGQTVVTVTIRVEDGGSPVEVSEKAVEDLGNQLKEGEAVAIIAGTTASVTVPTNIGAVIEKTGEPVSVGNKTAEVMITRELCVLFTGARAVEISLRTNQDGSIAISLMADGKDIRPENVRDGLSVRIPVSFSASSVKNVTLVKADKSTAGLEWKLDGGKLSVTLRESGVIRINRK